MGIDPELRARADAVAELRERVRCLWQQGLANRSLRPREYDIVRERYVTASGEFLAAVRELPDLLQAGNDGGVEAAITYLETAPRCFRSGYVAERLMRRLSRQPLTDSQRSRLTAAWGYWMGNAASSFANFSRFFPTSLRASRPSGRRVECLS